MNDRRKAYSCGRYLGKQAECAAVRVGTSPDAENAVHGGRARERYAISTAATSQRNGDASR